MRHVTKNFTGLLHDSYSKGACSAVLFAKEESLRNSVEAAYSGYFTFHLKLSKLA